MSCFAHSFLGPFGLLSSAVFSEPPFVPRPPCFFHLSISTILFSGRNSHLPTCSSLSLLAVEGYVQWKVRGSGSLPDYHTEACPLGDWLIPLQPLKAEQGAYLPGLVRRLGVLRARLGVRRLGDPRPRLCSLTQGRPHPPGILAGLCASWPHLGLED